MQLGSRPFGDTSLIQEDLGVQIRPYTERAGSLRRGIVDVVDAMSHLASASLQQRALLGCETRHYSGCPGMISGLLGSLWNCPAAIASASFS